MSRSDVNYKAIELKGMHMVVVKGQVTLCGDLGLQYLKGNGRCGSLSQPHFEASVRMKLTLPKVETWSPPGLPKTQSLITVVKTPCIEVLFIPLKIS
jgi:hypothetical protein